MANSTHSSQFLEFSIYNLRYSDNIWWDFSIEPLLCGWYADVAYSLMRNLFATFFISEDVKFAPWSVRMALGDPNRQINCFTKTSTVSTEEIPSIGIPIEYFVNKSWVVNIYSFPFCVFGNGPTISILILLNAVPGVSLSTSVALFLFWWASSIPYMFLRNLGSLSLCFPNNYVVVFFDKFLLLLCVLLQMIRVFLVLCCFMFPLVGWLFPRYRWW